MLIARPLIQVEMALSKLEQAGMNTSALKDLIASASADDVEIRSGEVVEAIIAQDKPDDVLITETKGAEEEEKEEEEEEEESEEASEGDAEGDGDDEQILEQLEQLEQELVTGECNQSSLTTIDVDREASPSPGTKDSSPETESDCDDADPADDLLDDPLQDLAVEVLVETDVQELHTAIQQVVQLAEQPAEQSAVPPMVDFSSKELFVLVEVINGIIAEIETASSEELKCIGPEPVAEEETKANAVATDSEVMISMPDRSEFNTELVDAGKSETAEADSTAHAIAEEVTEVEQPAKKSKRKTKKRSKTKVSTNWLLVLICESALSITFCCCCTSVRGRPPMSNLRLK